MNQNVLPSDVEGGKTTRPKWVDMAKFEVIARYKAGDKSKLISYELGIHPKTVNRWIRESIPEEHCIHCKTVHQLTKYNKGIPRKSDGHRQQYYICKPCNALKQQVYRASPKGRKAMNRINQKRRIKYVDKYVGFEVIETYKAPANRNSDIISKYS